MFRILQLICRFQFDSDFIPTFAAWMLNYRDFGNLADHFDFLRKLALDDQIQKGESMRDVCSLKSVLSSGSQLAIVKYIGLLDCLHWKALIRELTFDEHLSVMLRTEKVEPGLFHSTEGVQLLTHLLRESRGRTISWCAWALSSAGDSLISLFVNEFEKVAEFPDNEFWSFWIVVCAFRSKLETQHRILCHLAKVPHAQWSSIFSTFLFVGASLRVSSDYICHFFLLSIAEKFLEDPNLQDRDSFYVFYRLSLFFIFYRLGGSSLFNGQSLFIVQDVQNPLEFSVAGEVLLHFGMRVFMSGNCCGLGWNDSDLAVTLTRLYLRVPIPEFDELIVLVLSFQQHFQSQAECFLVPDLKHQDAVRVYRYHEQLVGERNPVNESSFRFLNDMNEGPMPFAEFQPSTYLQRMKQHEQKCDAKYGV
jgi:hypothetical protein